MPESLNLFVTCPPHVEPMLVEELTEILGTQFEQQIKAAKLGVQLSATLQEAYKICLWSRLANKVLVEVGSKALKDVSELAEFSHDCQWENWFPVGRTLRIDTTGKMRDLKTPLYAAQLVKDGIADRFREQTGVRPSIEKLNPDVRIVVALSDLKVGLYIDIAGGSLHRRGYRIDTGFASLKENLAAALLRKSNFHQVFKNYELFYDPMCGSGTLLTEAYMIAANIAPGLYRAHMGFERLNGYDATYWNELIKEARELRTEGTKAVSLKFVGHDISDKQLEAARKNIQRLNLSDDISVGKSDLLKSSNQFDKAFVMTNPPYGERLSDEESLKPLYHHLSLLGDALGEGSTLNVLSANEKLCREIMFKPAKRNMFANGQISCQLLQFDLASPYKFASVKKTALTEGATMVANRLVKNLKKLKKWREKNQIEAFRVYDADLPEYSAAIDVYGSQIVVQEYKAPKTIPITTAIERLKEVVAATASVFELDVAHVVVKQRSVQTRTQKYQKFDKREEYFEIQEYGVKSVINVHDYLDTGLFLDHRPVRQMIQERAQGKTFLNLFCYTAMATMHAIKGGATQTTSVDLSTNYLAWAEKNMQANKFNGSHKFIDADVMEWLYGCRTKFDLIFIDPPTFSNSKKLRNDFDVQRDHMQLIQKTLQLLAPGGTIIFSNNFRKFQLDPAITELCKVKEISKQTIDLDFERNPRIHRCWFMSHLES